jgi:VWFA-related protein
MAAVPATCLLILASAAAASVPTPPEPRVRSEVRVERIVLDAWVTGPDGAVAPGLSAGDFRVAVDGQAAEVESAEWIPADVPEVAAEAPVFSGGVAAPGPATPPPPGRVLVVFVQGDIGRYRTKGTMHAGQHLDPFLDSLLPSDRVAVVSFVSHLKLRVDFTNDRAAIREAFFASLYHTPPGPAPAPRDPALSLGRGLDARDAAEATSVDRALELVARALTSIPGGKAIVFFGWGFRVDRSPREHREHVQALAAIEKARVTVFTLDVTLADWHTLEEEMKQVSEETGGTYESLYLFPSGAVRRLSRRLAGRYVLVCVRPELPRGVHRVSVDLEGRAWSVTARTYTVDP